MAETSAGEEILEDLRKQYLRACGVAIARIWDAGEDLPDGWAVTLGIDSGGPEGTDMGFVLGYARAIQDKAHRGSQPLEAV